MLRERLLVKISKKLRAKLGLDKIQERLGVGVGVEEGVGVKEGGCNGQEGGCKGQEGAGKVPGEVVLTVWEEAWLLAMELRMALASSEVTHDVHHIPYTTSIHAI